MPERTTWADELRGAIRASGLTQTALAEASGVPQGTISKFLDGADIRLSRAEALARAVGITLDTSAAA